MPRPSKPNMKPHVKPPAKGGGAGATAKPLTGEHEQFLSDCRDAFMEMCAAAEISEEEIQSGDATEVCDQVVRWWHAQRKNQRPDFDAAANIIGVAMGDLLISAFPVLAWKYITDRSGTSLGLWHLKPEVVVAPLDLSLANLNEEPDGFVGGLLPGLADEVERMLKG